MPDKSQNQEAVGRKDLTKGLPAHQRRLDAFARLLAARSQCVAVTMVDGKLYISANELQEKSRIGKKDNADYQEENNKNYAAICKIANYFKDITSGKAIDADKREEIFCDVICTSFRFQVTDSNLVQDIAKNAMKRVNPTISTIIDQYGANFDIAGSMYSEFKSLYRDFSKLEKTLKSKNSTPLIDELKDAIKKFDVNNVLTREKQSGIHAEMQLLATITKTITKDLEKSKQSSKQKIYLGISKLSCLSCRCMLESANKIFKDNGIPITFEVRGRHDLFFSNWEPPNVLRSGYQAHVENEADRRVTRQIEEQKKSSSNKNLGIAFLIGKDGHAEIDKCKVAKEQAKAIQKASGEKQEESTAMRADRSDSDEESVRSEQMKDFGENLKKTLKFITDMQKLYGRDPSKTIKLISIAVNLHEIKKFLELPKKISGINNEEDRIRTLQELLIAYNNKNKRSNITIDTLNTVMKDANLVDKNLAEFFIKVFPNSSREESKDKSRLPGLSSRLQSSSQKIKKNSKREREDNEHYTETKRQKPEVQNVRKQRLKV